MPKPDKARSRLRFESVERETTVDGHCRVSVRLEWKGNVHEATVVDLETQHGLIKAASTAALQAALLVADAEVRLEMVGVKAVRAFDGWVVVARVNSGPDSFKLLGAAPCESEEDLPKAAVLAVLDASNRVLERSLPSS